MLLLKTWSFFSQVFTAPRDGTLTYGILLLGGLSCFSIDIGQAQNTPKYSNEFLNIGVGGRGLGMSNAQVAIVNDVTAGYWNPAGLLQIQDKYQASLMHSEYFAGIAQYDYAAFATPIDSVSHLGISLIRFGVDNIPDTRFLYDADGRLNYDNIRFFNSADYAFLFSYARKSNLLRGLRLGATFKVVYRNAGDFANAWGFGLDFGAQLTRKNWHFGLMLKDITGTFNAWTHNTSLIFDTFTQTNNEIPENAIEITLPKLFLGIAYQFRIREKVGVLSSLDLGTTFDGPRNVLIRSDVVSMDPSLGFELDYQKIVFLRVSVGKFQQIKDASDGSKYWTAQPNFGVGIKIKRVSLDYALSDIGDQAEGLYSNVFSLKVGFGSNNNAQ